LTTAKVLIKKKLKKEAKNCAQGFSDGIRVKNTELEIFNNVLIIFSPVSGESKNV